VYIYKINSDLTFSLLFLIIFQTAEEWQLVFWITALVYAFGVIFFALTVSGDRQPWNDGIASKSDDTVESGGGDDDQSASINPEPEAKVTDVRKLSSPGNKEPKDNDNQTTKKSPEADKKSDQSSPKESSKDEDKESEQSSPNNQANQEDEATEGPASPKDEGNNDDATKQTEPTNEQDGGEANKKE